MTSPFLFKKLYFDIHYTPTKMKMQHFFGNDSIFFIFRFYCTKKYQEIRHFAISSKQKETSASQLLRFGLLLVVYLIVKFVVKH